MIKTDMENISLDILKTFVVYVRSESMVQAAKILGLSQPAITFQLKKLEKDLPVSPFIGKGQRKSLSPFGKKLFSLLNRRFQHIDDDLGKLMFSFLNPEERVYRLGARKEVLSRILTKIDIKGRLEIFSFNDEEIKKNLLEGEIDIGITFQNIESSGLHKKLLFSDGGMFCVHKDFLKGEPLTLSLIKKMSFLQNVPVIAYNKNLPYLREWIDSLNDGDVNKLQVKCSYEDWDDIVTLVESGQGFSIVPSEIPVRSNNVLTKVLPSTVIVPKEFYAYFSKEIEPEVVESMLGV